MFIDNMLFLSVNLGKQSQLYCAYVCMHSEHNIDFSWFCMPFLLKQGILMNLELTFLSSVFSYASVQ